MCKLKQTFEKFSVAWSPSALYERAFWHVTQLSWTQPDYVLRFRLSVEFTGDNGAQRNCRPVQRFVIHYFFVFHVFNR